MPHPDAAWVAQQAKNFTLQAEDAGMAATHVIHDWDTKYTAQFDAILESEGVEIHRVGPMKPNLNAYAERFVQSIQQECLDHFIVLGDRHLNHIVGEYVAHYHLERPHQGVGNRPLTAQALAAGEGEIICRERLGGLLRHYERRAA